MFVTEMEVPMQKWPYADFAHINVAYFRNLQKSNPAQIWEHLTVETVIVSENAVMFFDHYANEYKKQRSELDDYFVQVNADGWKLTHAGSTVNGKGYQVRRYHFRRVKS
jgi:hypothetical protein